MKRPPNVTPLHIQRNKIIKSTHNRTQTYNSNKKRLILKSEYNASYSFARVTLHQSRGKKNRRLRVDAWL